MKKILFALIATILFTPSAFASDLVWPGEPEKPRIRYLYTINSPKDLGGKKKGGGFFKKFVKTLAGGESKGAAIKGPYGIFARKGKVYFADPKLPAVTIADVKKKTFTPVAGTGIDAHKIPVGVTIDDQGNIFIADSLAKVVRKFSPDGKRLWETSSLNKQIGAFLRPAGVAWHPNGDLYVADPKLQTVVVLDSVKGKFKQVLFEQGDPGFSSSPSNVSIHPNGEILVLDTLTCRLHRWSPENEFVDGFGKRGDTHGYFARPRATASDSDGNIYVVDAMFDNVQIFRPDGRVLMAFATHGKGPGGLMLPSGIAIDEKDRIFISDTGNARIEVYQYIKYPGNSLEDELKEYEARIKAEKDELEKKKKARNKPLKKEQ